MESASSEQEELARSLCKLMWPNPSAANQSAADFLLDQTESGGKWQKALSTRHKYCHGCQLQSNTDQPGLQFLFFFNFILIVLSSVKHSIYFDLDKKKKEKNSL